MPEESKLEASRIMDASRNLDESNMGLVSFQNNRDDIS